MKTFSIGSVQSFNQRMKRYLDSFYFYSMAIGSVRRNWRYFFDAKVRGQYYYKKDNPAYGYRRVTLELKNRGWKVNHKRVQRVMH